MTEIIRLAPGEPCPEAGAGDFMLIQGRGPLSQVMRLVLHYTHVVSFTEYPRAGDAQARGVIERDTSVYDDADRVLVRLEASEEDRRQMLDFLESVLARKFKYNFIGFIVTGFQILKEAALKAARVPSTSSFSIRRYNTSYCSGLQAETATRAGYIFDRPPSSVSPDDLARHFGVL